MPGLTKIRFQPECGLGKPLGKARLRFPAQDLGGSLNTKNIGGYINISTRCVPAGNRITKARLHVAPECVKAKALTTSHIDR